MFGFVLRRVGVAIPTILVIITIAFFMMRAAPGGPFDLERPMPEETRQILLANYGMDQPLWRQYLDYMGDLARGDLGPSLKLRDKQVNEIIAEGFPVSATIGLFSMLLAITLGSFLGSVAALRQKGNPAKIVSSASWRSSTTTTSPPPSGWKVVTTLPLPTVLKPAPYSPPTA